MERTKDGLRIVNGMVELPRNPVDEKLDDLSPRAANLLKGWLIGNEKPIERFFGWTAHLQELLDAGLTEATGNEHGGGDGYKLTFDGWNGAERLRCGAYHHGLAIERKRRERDEAMESHPLYGLF